MRKILSLLLCVSTLGACVYTGDFSTKAVDYNKDLERSIGVTALMNVVRASERLPMTYSRMGSMSYQGSITANPEATLAFGSDADKDLFKLGYSTGEQGTVPFNAQTDQEFYNAIFQSVSGERIKYYRDRGYTDAILFSLFIERIEIEDKSTLELIKAVKGNTDKASATVVRSFKKQKNADKAKESYSLYAFENDPGKKDAFSDFMAIVKHVIKTYDVNLTVIPNNDLPPTYCVGKNETTCLNPSAPPKSTAPCLKRDNRFGLRGKKVSDQTCRLLKGSYEVAALDGVKEINSDLLSKGSILVDGIVYAKFRPQPRLEFIKRQDDGNSDGQISPCTVASDSDVPQDCDVRIVLRSPDAMLYYLGQLQRAQETSKIRYFLNLDPPGNAPILIEKAVSNTKNKNKKSGSRPLKDGYEPMFFIEKNTAATSFLPKNALYNFELHGSSYWIPNQLSQRGHTMEFINLINEVISLNQKRSEPPTVTLLSGGAIR